MMITTGSTNGKTILDRKMLMTLKTCPACDQPFTLGERVVLACGDWAGPMRFIHENEAVYDAEEATYVERRCQRTDSAAVDCCSN